jgi:hypothetical protein
MPPVTQLLDFSCDNFATCGTPPVNNATGIPPGWAKLGIDYTDPGGGSHHWNIVLCSVDTPKFVQAFPSVAFP